MTFTLRKGARFIPWQFALSLVGPSIMLYTLMLHPTEMQDASMSLFILGCFLLGGVVVGIFEMPRRKIVFHWLPTAVLPLGAQAILAATLVQVLKEGIWRWVVIGIYGGMIPLTVLGLSLHYHHLLNRRDA